MEVGAVLYFKTQKFMSPSGTKDGKNTTCQLVRPNSKQGSVRVITKTSAAKFHPLQTSTS
jgi:hypothetical protein